MDTTRRSKSSEARARKFRTSSRKPEPMELTRTCKAYSRNGRKPTSKSSRNTQLTSQMIWRSSNKLWRRYTGPREMALPRASCIK